MKRSLALRWGVRSARLTTLHIGRPAATAWWPLLYGSRAIHTWKKGAGTEESGLVEGRNLSLSDQPTRFDVVVTPDPSTATPEMPITSIGTLETVSERMSQLATKLTGFKEFPVAHRLAFGITLRQVGFNRSDALRTLASVFPELTKELKRSTDFVFQINHPAKGELEEMSLRIHFLEKWYFAELKLDGGSPTAPIDAFSANVDLDISTDIAPDRRWTAEESAQIIPLLIQSATVLLEQST